MKSAKLIITTASMALAAMLTQPVYAASSIDTHSHMFVAAKVADKTKLNATKAVPSRSLDRHVFWVRNVVVAEIAGDSAALQAAEKQVVANAQAIAGSIEPFYGAPAKEQLFTLLAGHYGAVKAYLDASIAKDDGKQSEAIAKLMSNAAEIALFLNSANQYLPKDDVDGLLQAHGGHHIAQIQHLLDKDYAGEAQTWADMTQHMYVIADATADALAKQFQAKF